MSLCLPYSVFQLCKLCKKSVRLNFHITSVKIELTYSEVVQFNVISKSLSGGIDGSTHAAIA